MPDVRISTITVCWNSAKTIEDTLRSVAAQEYPLVEHIVVDGGSTDGTLDIVKRYPHVARVVSERDKGIYDAMNKGVRLATGDVIGLINADDFYATPHALSHVARAFQDPAVEVTYADLCYVSQHDVSQIVRYWKSSEYAHGAFLSGWCPPHPTFFVRRDVYERFGNFDMQYRIAADVDVMIRFLAKHRVKAQYIPETLVMMRTGGNSNAGFRSVLRQNREILHSLERNGHRANVARFAVGKLLSRGRQFLTRPK